MEQLYLETENGTVLIDSKLVKKYHLNAGTYSPFTRQRIIGTRGSFELKGQELIDIDVPEEGYHDDGVDLMQNGFQMSTSEILDFAEGTDSD